MESFDFQAWPEGRSPSGEVQTSTDSVVVKPVVPDTWLMRSRRYWSAARLGKLSLAVLSVVIAAKAGLALDHNVLAFSLESDRESQQRMLPASQAVQQSALSGDAELFPADLRFTQSLKWLSQSSSGLKFAMPGEHFQSREMRQETQAAVRELMDIPLRVDKSSQVRNAVPRVPVQHGAGVRLELDPDMMKLVADLPDPEVFAKGLHGKSRDPIKKDPFTQKELIELASMR
ncbi:MAG: hypothetical protein HQL74_04360 [Magnetococcales bacterium]|nr:hypothetical protein [Magnetococcales bacterium]